MPQSWLHTKQYTADVVERPLPLARRLAVRHQYVDLAHLLAADLQSADSCLRPHLPDDQADNFLDELQTFCLERVPARPAEGEPPPYGDEIAEIDRSFAERAAVPGHNLDRIVTAMPPAGERLPWAYLLAGALAYRPHRLQALLATYRLSFETLLPAVAAGAGGTGAAATGPEFGDRQALDQYTVNLTARDDLGEAIGRVHEVDRLVTVLGRKEGNNAILLGEAGVGKTKIVEGLAHRLAQGDVHPRLRGKEILQLDLGLLVAGAQYLGQFQDRLKSLLRALKEARGRYILFIDEIHQLLGLGQTSGAMDAANLMKPALARGELWCVGATTYAEYRHLEKDPALRRRFQPIDVPEQSPEEVEQILERVAPAYALHHRVRYQRDALSAVVRLARRYLGETRSPAREVGLLDEIGSAVSKDTPSTGDEPESWPLVDVGHIARAVASRTGIPVDRVDADRRQAVVDLRAALTARVFGQDQILEPVVRKLRRAFLDLNRPGRPRAVFFFAGPSGVGKTEMAKALAEHLFDSPQALVRLDMSEYAAETARNRLVGAEAGYVGYEEGGQLTEAVRRRPYSLILLDEFEKAHPTVWRLFLQVFDEGRLTDARGRTANFAETVIVMTSNVGALLTAKAQELSERLQRVLREESDPAARRRRAAEEYEQVTRSIPGMTAAYHEILGGAAEAVLAGQAAHIDPQEITRRALLAVRDFPPELFGRIGPPLVFHPLGREALRRVLRRYLADLCLRLAAPLCPQLPDRPAAQAPWLESRDEADGSVEVVCRPPGGGSPISGVRLSAAWAETLLDRGSDPVFGARALWDLFEEEVEGAVADDMLRRPPNEPRLFDLRRGE